MDPSSRPVDLAGRVGIGLLVTAFLVIGFRAYRSSELILAQERGAAPQISDNSVTSADERSAGLQLIPSRDPFRYVDAAKPRSEPRPVVEEKEEPRPVLGALLYDLVKPQVQLRVGSEASGWIGAGAVFKGWVVVAIEPDAVIVQKQGERLVLR